MNIMKKFLGYILISIPFITLAVSIFLRGGMKDVIIIFGSAAIVVGLIYLGVYLIYNE